MVEAVGSAPSQLAVWEQKLADAKAGIGKKAGYIKWGGAFALLVLLGPAILTGALAGIVGLIAAVLGLVVVHWWPVISFKIANRAAEAKIAEYNRHIAAIKAEARKNPVETMQSVYIEQGRQLKERSEKIQKFATKVNKYGQKLSDLKKQFPNETATFDKVHQDMSELLRKRQQKWTDAKAKHDLSAHEIEKAQAFWEMGLATQDLRESAGDVEAEFFQRIRKETAMDAVQEQLASAMADLDQLLMEEVTLSPVERQAISNNPSPVLDVQAVEIKQEVRR